MNNRSGTGWGYELNNMWLCKSCGKRAQNKPEQECMEPKHLIQYKKYLVQAKQIAAREINKQKKQNRELKSKYGITLEEFNSKKEEQRGLCAICEKFKKLTVDHDHNTGSPRGLLCHDCNTGLRFIENEEFMEKAKDYLNSPAKWFKRKAGA